MTDVRAALETLIRDRRDDYASLSRLIGRNAAYIQQFIHRGVPRKLDEDDRRLLARYFSVDEAVLGGPVSQDRVKPLGRKQAGGIVLIPRLSIGASAGPGALVQDELAQAQIGFEADWLRKFGSNPSDLSIIQVKGDSMAPTLADGDDILVDRGDAALRLRDGIFVMRIDDALIVKRVALNPVNRTVTIRSDNPSYPDWTDCDPASIDVIGRVIWIGRKLV